MNLSVIIVALGFVCIIEGIPYVASPGAVKRFMTQILSIPDSHLRAAGFFALVAGLLLVFLGARILH